MAHKIHRVASLVKPAPFTLRVQFTDGTSQTIDFRFILKGELYSPLPNPVLFYQVSIDPGVYTLVWPNGADFDPAILHNSPESGPKLKALTDKWEAAKPGLSSEHNPPL